MSFETPTGQITHTTPIKAFEELTNISTSQYVLGIQNITIGNGAKITFGNIINSLISTNANNKLVKGNDNKLFISTPVEIGTLSNLTTTNKSNLVAAINEVNADLADYITSENNKIGDLTELDTVDKSSIVNSINEIADIVEPELITINNSKALTTGAVGNNAAIYSDILNYAHSTFDRSKFAVVGSPNITDDGIASGFSSSNSINVTNLSISSSSEIVIRIRNIIKSSSSSVYLSSSTMSFYVEQYSSTLSTVVRMTNSDGTVLLSGGVISAQDAEIGDVIDTIITLKSGANKIEVYRNGILYQSSTRTSTFATDQTFSSFRLGNNISSTSQYSRNDIDLKQFSITVDGVEVFNGNKTGIDIIKPDDYEVVGTPMISADGVLTGAASSGIRIPINITSGQQVQYTFSYTHKTNSDLQFLLASLEDNNNNHNLYLITNDHNSFNISYNNIDHWVQNFNFVENQTYLIELLTDYSSYIKLDIDNVEKYSDLSAGITYGANNNISLGNNLAFSNNRNIVGSIDLNSFKVYIDGNLVYQPCLKIPYTQSSSKYGSKIVNAVYRDRVQDAWEQNFSQRYYTLDETNQNFTLPMGEIYGMIEEAKTEVTELKNSVTDLVMPDYANGISISINTDYLAPANGWIYAVGNNAGGSLYINDINFGQFDNRNDVGSDQNTTFIPVSKNDKIKLTAGALTFFPCKGV